MTIPALPTIDVGVPANLRLIRVAVPLRRPHAWAGGQVSVRESVIVEWTRPDGVTGWGECPAMEGYVTGGIDQAWSGLVELSGRLVADSVAAGPAGTWDGEVESIPTVSLGAMADAALDAALRSANASFHEFLGANGTPLDRTVVIGGPGADPAARLESVASARASGAACVKLKVDPSTSADLVRRCVEGGGPVAVDANGSLSADAAAAFDALGLLYIEQPFPAGVLWDDLADYQEGALTAMALDESLGSLDDLDEALAAAAADVVSVKPARLGGLWAAAEGVRRAAEAGVGCFVGGMVELGVHRAGAAAVASYAATVTDALPTDLGPSSAYVVEDITDPVACDAAGRLLVPVGPGIGVVPLLSRVDAASTAVWTSGE